MFQEYVGKFLEYWDPKRFYSWCELETVQHVVTGADGCRPTVSARPMPWSAVKKLKKILKVRKVVEAGSTLRVHHVQRN